MMVPYIQFIYTNLENHSSYVKYGSISKSISTRRHKKYDQSMHVIYYGG
jgi:hypothetical protein